jgi:hypothetical protein
MGSGTTQFKLDHVRLAHSGDGGSTFDARYAVEDPSAGAFFMLPNIVSDEQGGVHVTYYAGVDSGDAAASYRASLSTDGGATFGPSGVVHAPLLFDLSRATPTWLGDYQGLWVASGKLYIAYVDNSSGASHVAFYRAPAQ